MSSTKGNVITINSASPEEIKAFLLSDRAYFTVALPEYFSFHPLLEAAYQLVPDDLVSLSDNILQDCRKVKANYVIYGNKDGKYAWRAYELIHPVLYALLVKIIVARIDEIKNKLTSESDKIKCMSLPSWNEKDIVRPSATMIERWWEGIELESIALSMRYRYIFHTDIHNCYGSIYTHSIPWAIHGKERAKKMRKESSLGNVIDRILQAMNHGQTNGIPVGSILSDLVAEIVLFAIDRELERQTKDIKDFVILRYRDDYRIFTNHPADGEKILYLLSKELSQYGMRLNPLKTQESTDVILSSVKPDKLYLLTHFQRYRFPIRHLLFIYSIAKEYPNSGTVQKLLSQYAKFLRKIFNSESKSHLTKRDKRLIDQIRKHTSVIIAILTNIAASSPRTIPTFVLMVDTILRYAIESESHTKSQIHTIIDSILARLRTLPYPSLAEIWLQRLALGHEHNVQNFEEEICRSIKESIDCGTGIIFPWKEVSFEEGSPLNDLKYCSIIDQAKLRATKGTPISPSYTEVFPY